MGQEEINTLEAIRRALGALTEEERQTIEALAQELRKKIAEYPEAGWALALVGAEMAASEEK